MVTLPFIGSLVTALLPPNSRNAEAWLAGAMTLCSLAMALLLQPEVASGGVFRFELPWLPDQGMNFVLRLDGFSWMFSVLITGIGLLVVLYARYYLSPADSASRFFSLLLAFMGSMLGVVLAGDLIVLGFFWELTSLFSFLLIGYWHQSANAREGARMALTVTGIGGLCLFGGLLVLGNIVGSYDLDRVLASREVIQAHPLYPTALVLILLGALTKSAQFPFHFWLPHAMAAPTPVSAYLHSATMVKAGVFLMARFWPVLSGTDLWFWIVGGTGMVTLLFGGFVAIFQQDLKGLLAYSTIGNLGLITLLLGLDSELALVAAVFHIMNHATFKASLFMAVGIIDHEAGTRDMQRLSGLYRLMPYTGTLAVISTAAMAGVPLLNGFLSKEMFLAETVEVGADTVLEIALPVLATVASIFSVTYSARFILRTFFGPPAVDLPRIPHEPPYWMRLPVEILAVLCLVVGILPAQTVGPILVNAVQAVLGSTPSFSLALWHGFNLPLLMSVIALSGGVLLYIALRRYLMKGIEGPPLLRQFKGKRIFERVMVALSWRFARSLEAMFGTRRLQPQLFLVVVAAVLAAWVPLRAGLTTGSKAPLPTDASFVLLAGVGMACAIGAAWMAKFHRVTALMLMSGAGLITCMTFVWFSAPDLALTQLLVEVVTTVLILLGLRWLPRRLEEHAPKVRPVDRARRLRDLILAVIAGGGLAGVAWAVMTRPLPPTISQFFLERAYVDGGGTNVVNVILVDFRGFDTFGEITVLAVASLVIYALLRTLR
ncbi:MAG: monovalent cation/H+ antiporter subunit A, partial [Myxococcaceae bacterium]